MNFKYYYDDSNKFKYSKIEMSPQCRIFVYIDFFKKKSQFFFFKIS